MVTLEMVLDPRGVQTGAAEVGRALERGKRLLGLRPGSALVLQGLLQALRVLDRPASRHGQRELAVRLGRILPDRLGQLVE